MWNVNFLRNFECVCCPEFSLFFHDWIILFAITISVITIMIDMTWRVVYTFGSAIVGSKHLNLAKMRDFYHNCVIIYGERLLPWFSIDPHERVVSCTLMKLKPDTMCLQTGKCNKNIQKENAAQVSDDVPTNRKLMDLICSMKV